MSGVKYIYNTDDNIMLSSPYRRELSNNEKESLKKKYEIHAKSISRGILTPYQRKRLLEMKRKERGTTDSDFWYKLKRNTKNGIVDLQMICEIADDEQIKEIFQKILIKKIEKNQLVKDEDFVSIENLISLVLVATDRKSREKDDLWKALFVKDLLNACLNYIVTSGILMTQSHMRLIEEMRDLVNAVVGVTLQVPKENRNAIKF